MRELAQRNVPQKEEQQQEQETDTCLVYSKSRQEARKLEEKLKGRTGVENRKVTQASHVVVRHGHGRDSGGCSVCVVGIRAS